MTDYPGDNRRQEPRVNYPCSITVWRKDGNEEVIMAQTANIGVGGAAVYLNCRLIEGIPVELKLKYSKDRDPLKCKGTVLRSEETDKDQAEGQPFFRIAIKFNDMDDDEKDLIREVIIGLIELEEKK